MEDKVYIEISVHLLSRLNELHDKWRKENSQMAQQPASYVIWRLIEEYERKEAKR